MKRIICVVPALVLGWQAFAGELDDAYKHATDAVKQAKTAADLDPVLDELTGIIEKDAPQSGCAEPAKQESQKGITLDKLGDARAFVQKWQDYLAAKAGGYNAEAQAMAKDLADRSTLLLPRSVILAKAYERKKADQKVAPATTTPAPVAVTLEQDGKVSIEKDAPVDLARFKEELARLQAENQELAIVLRVRRSTPYKNIREVLGITGSAGIANVGVCFVEPSSSGETRDAPAASLAPSPQPSPTK